MKQALAVCVAVMTAAACVAAADTTNWVEPSYAEAEPSLVETSAAGRLRGISHTLAPHRRMVTYISPARKLQTSGIVLTPPPVVSVTTATAPTYLQPIVYPRAVYGGVVRRHHLPGLTIDDFGPNGDDHYDVPHPHHMWAHAHAGHHHRHIHPIHANSRTTVRVSSLSRAHTGVGVAGHAHHYGGNPLAVPASLFTQPYHQPHYSHRSPISQGPILVPHGPAGAIAVEESDYTGYNPGPVYQLNSVPTGYYSDGTPYRASINQRYL